jgi:hypothetical protein
MPCYQCGEYKELPDDPLHGICRGEYTYSKAIRKRVVGRDGIVRLLTVVRWNDSCSILEEKNRKKV